MTEITFHVSIKDVLEYCKTLFGVPTTVEIGLDNVIITYGPIINTEDSK